MLSQSSQPLKQQSLFSAWGGSAAVAPNRRSSTINTGAAAKTAAAPAKGPNSYNNTNRRQSAPAAVVTGKQRGRPRKLKAAPSSSLPSSSIPEKQPEQQQQQPKQQKTSHSLPQKSVEGKKQSARSPLRRVQGNGEDRRSVTGQPTTGVSKKAATEAENTVTTTPAKSNGTTTTAAIASSATPTHTKTAIVSKADTKTATTTVVNDSAVFDSIAQQQMKESGHQKQQTHQRQQTAGASMMRSVKDEHDSTMYTCSNKGNNNNRETPPSASSSKSVTSTSSNSSSSLGTADAIVCSQEIIDLTQTDDDAVINAGFCQHHPCGNSQDMPVDLTQDDDDYNNNNDDNYYFGSLFALKATCSAAAVGSVNKKSPEKEVAKDSKPSPTLETIRKARIARLEKETEMVNKSKDSPQVESPLEVLRKARLARFDSPVAPLNKSTGTQPEQCVESSQALSVEPRRLSHETTDGENDKKEVSSANTTSSSAESSTPVSTKQAAVVTSAHKQLAGTTPTRNIISVGQRVRVRFNEGPCPLRPGQHYRACGGWYPGILVGFTNQRQNAKILFDDEQEVAVPYERKTIECFRAGTEPHNKHILYASSGEIFLESRVSELALGDLVFGNFQNRGKWHRGRVAQIISSIRSQLCSIAYDDGDYETNIPFGKNYETVRLVHNTRNSHDWLIGLSVRVTPRGPMYTIAQAPFESDDVVLEVIYQRSGKPAKVTKPYSREKVLEKLFAQYRSQQKLAYDFKAVNSNAQSPVHCEKSSTKTVSDSKSLKCELLQKLKSTEIKSSSSSTNPSNDEASVSKASNAPVCEHSSKCSVGYSSTVVAKHQSEGEKSADTQLQDAKTGATDLKTESENEDSISDLVDESSSVGEEDKVVNRKSRRGKRPKTESYFDSDKNNEEFTPCGNDDDYDSEGEAAKTEELCSKKQLPVRLLQKKAGQSIDVEDPVKRGRPGRLQNRKKRQRNVESDSEDSDEDFVLNSSIEREEEDSDSDFDLPKKQVIACTPVDDVGNKRPVRAARKKIVSLKESFVNFDNILQERDLAVTTTEARGRKRVAKEAYETKCHKEAEPNSQSQPRGALKKRSKVQPLEDVESNAGKAEPRRRAVSAKPEKVDDFTVASFEPNFDGFLPSEAHAFVDQSESSQREFNNAQAMAFAELLNSDTPHYGVDFAALVTKFHKHMPAESFCKMLLKLMQNGPSSGKTFIPDCNRMDLAFRFCRFIFSQPGMLDKFVSVASDTCWGDFLNAMSKDYYMAEGDEQRITGDAFERIGQTVHIKACSVKFFLALLEHETAPCLLGTKSYGEQRILRSIVDHRRGAKEALERSVRALVHLSCSLGHFTLADSFSWNESSHVDIPTPVQLSALQIESTRLIKAMSKVCSHLAWLYGKSEHEDVDSVADLISNMIINEIQIRNSKIDASPFLDGMSTETFWLKLKLRIVLSFDQRMFPKLRPALATKLGIGYQYNIVYGRIPLKTF